MGIGHVMRCLALGQAWRDAGGDVCFLGSIANQSLLHRLFAEGLEVRELMVPYTESSDLYQLHEIVASVDQGACIVLDGYHFDIAYQRQARLMSSRLLVIDDYRHISNYACDLLLNQNVNAAALKYQIEGGGSLLLGPKYAMLRREFMAASQTKKTIRNNVRTVLVSFGGSDPGNASELAVEALALLQDRDLRVIVVAGPACSHLSSLRAAMDRLPCRAELLVDVQDMTPLMLQADLAVGAAGSSCLEWAHFGVPFVGMIVAENQVGLAAGMAQSGAASIVGWQHDVSSEALCLAIRSLMQDKILRQNMSLAGRTLVDGQGAARVRDCLLKASPMRDVQC